MVIELLLDMQAQSAVEQGLVKENIFKKLSQQTIGSIFNLEGIPTIEKGKYGKQASFPTNKGFLQTNNAALVASLESKKPLALGNLIKTSLKNGKSLPLRVVEVTAKPSGRTYRTLDIYTE